MKRSPIMILTLALVIAALSSGVATAAGTANWTMQNTGRFNIYRCAWESDPATGAVSAGAGVNPVTITGQILGINFKSDPNAIPTNLYDVELYNEQAEPILSDGTTSAGADIPSAINAPGQRRSVLNSAGRSKILNNETLTPSISNAGNSKRGFIELMVW